MTCFIGYIKGSTKPNIERYNGIDRGRIDQVKLTKSWRYNRGHSSHWSNRLALRVQRCRVPEDSLYKSCPAATLPLLKLTGSPLSSVYSCPLNGAFFSYRVMMFSMTFLRPYTTSCWKTAILGSTWVEVLRVVIISWYPKFY